MSTAVIPTIAFFGATGGCGNAALVHSLNGGHKCAALARTPDKLRKQLSDQGVSASTISSQLVIIQGSATVLADVKKTLTAGGAGQLVSTIVSGLGGTVLKLNLELRHPLHLIDMDPNTICADGARAIVAALREIYSEQPALKANMPAMIYVATTGITRGPEDVPFAMRFLYHQLLAIPHMDKKNMDDIFRNNVENGGSAQVFKIVSGVRPTLLGGTVDVKDRKGLAAVRAGTEDKPELGYNIKRADVGEWIYKHLIQDGPEKVQWEGQMCSLTS